MIKLLLEYIIRRSETRVYVLAPSPRGGKKICLHVTVLTSQKFSVLLKPVIYFPFEGSISGLGEMVQFSPCISSFLGICPAELGQFIVAEIMLKGKEGSLCGQTRGIPYLQGGHVAACGGVGLHLRTPGSFTHRTLLLVRASTRLAETTNEGMIGLLGRWKFRDQIFRKSGWWKESLRWVLGFPEKWSLKPEPNTGPSSPCTTYSVQVPSSAKFLRLALLRISSQRGVVCTRCEQ